MRAAVFTSPKTPLAIDRVADPSPKPGHMILEVAYAGICGSDLHLKQYGGTAPGTVFGHEFAGTVVGLSAGVTDWKIGDRVSALPLDPCRQCEACDSGLVGLCYTAPFTGTSIDRPGAYAEYVSVAASMSQALPAGVSFIEGAMIEPLAVAYHAVELGPVAKDSAVLVIGAGPIGAGVSVFARMKGAKHVVVSERSAERRALVMELGATAVIDPTNGDVSAKFRALTGRSPDVVFECVGVSGLLKEAISHAGLRGRVIVAGACTSDDTFTPMAALNREISIQFSQCYTEQDFDAVIKAIAQGNVNVMPMHSRTVGFDELPVAFEELSNSPRDCKVLLDPSLS